MIPDGCSCGSGARSSDTWRGPAGVSTSQMVRRYASSSSASLATVEPRGLEPLLACKGPPGIVDAEDVGVAVVIGIDELVGQGAVAVDLDEVRASVAVAVRPGSQRAAAAHEAYEAGPSAAALAQGANPVQVAGATEPGAERRAPVTAEGGRGRHLRHLPRGRRPFLLRPQPNRVDRADRHEGGE